MTFFEYKNLFPSWPFQFQLKPILGVSYNMTNQIRMVTLIAFSLLEYNHNVQLYTPNTVHIYRRNIYNKIINNYLSLVIIYPIFYCKRSWRLLHCSFILNSFFLNFGVYITERGVVNVKPRGGMYNLLVDNKAFKCS